MSNSPSSSVVSKGEVSRSNSKNLMRKSEVGLGVHMICASFSPCYVDWNANYCCRVTLFFPSCFTFAQLISGSSIQICDFSIYLLKSWEILCFLPSPWGMQIMTIGIMANRAESPEHQTTNTLFFGCILGICAKICHVMLIDFVEYPILWRKLT